MFMMIMISRDDRTVHCQEVFLGFGCYLMLTLHRLRISFSPFLHAIGHGHRLTQLELGAIIAMLYSNNYYVIWRYLK